MLEVDDEGGRMFLRVLLHLTMHDYAPLVSGALQLLFKHFSQRQEAMHTFKQVRSATCQFLDLGPAWSPGAHSDPAAHSLTGVLGLQPCSDPSGEDPASATFVTSWPDSFLLWTPLESGQLGTPLLIIPYQSDLQTSLAELPGVCHCGIHHVPLKASPEMPADQGWHLASAHNVLVLDTSLHWFPRIPLAPSVCDTPLSPM